MVKCRYRLQVTVAVLRLEDVTRRIVHDNSDNQAQRIHQFESIEEIGLRASQVQCWQTVCFTSDNMCFHVQQNTSRTPDGMVSHVPHRQARFSMFDPAEQ